MTTHHDQMTIWVRDIVDAPKSWAGVELAPHRFGGTEFQLGKRELGHIHRNGMLDIPFNRALKAELLAEGKAEPHHLLADSGWISFYVRSSNDVLNAIWLLKLAYIFTARTLQKQQRELPSDLNVGQWVDALAPSGAIRAILEK